MASNIDKFRGLLRELFQLDQADLDFGIYRIMNQKRDEVVRFLDKDLLPQVQQAFAKYKSSDKTALQAELAKRVTAIEAEGMNPDDSPKIKALKQQIAESSVDVAGLESEVYSHLFNFFRRYYDDGDFISLRRYKEGVYAIPYEGEEVKLHWANADQYYVKSSEYLRDYAFNVGGGKKVHFRLTEADTEKDNNQAAAGNERRFALADGDDAVTEVGGELIIRFNYKPDEQKRKQTALNDAAEKRIIESAPGNWPSALSALRSVSTLDPKPSVLRHHIRQYMARNTFDYFIHKSLGGFLRRELDFYVKNEVMYLDDVLPTEQQTPEQQQAVLTAAQSKMASRLSVIAILRDIAHKIIRFLAQIEDFQKKLWLKKKFVVSTDWLVTIDRVPPSLRDVVAKNERQWIAWESLGFKPESEGNPNWRTRQYIDATDKLVVDTRLFERPFVLALLASEKVLNGHTSLDAAETGILVHSDNFQALSLMQNTLRQRVDCIYIDPPYNTAVSAIPYKNNYKHSTFATMIRDRVGLLASTLSNKGVFFVSIDKTERTTVEFACNAQFGVQNRIDELIWVQNTNDGRSPTYSTNHEYVMVYAADRPAVEADPRIFREPKPGYDEVAALIHSYGKSYPPVTQIESDVATLFREHRRAYRKEVEAAGLLWDTEKRNDPWKGIYQYRFAEYRSRSGELLTEEEAEEREALIWVYRKSDWTIMSSESKQSQSTRDPKHPNYRFYSMTHPVTGKDCKMPSRGWKGTRLRDSLHPHRNSFESLQADNRIAFGSDEATVPQQKRMLHEVSTNVSKTVIVDYADGEKQTTSLFGRGGVFLAPKHSGFVRRFLSQASRPDSIVLDCFGGSGSTAHAVLEMNRIDDGTRKFILVETNSYIDTLILPRVAKLSYSPEWTRGKPKQGQGSSCLVKVLRLEGYEDTLNNLRLTQTEEQADLLSQHKAMAEEYMLGYLLDTESRGSASLLNVQAFSNPFAYTLNVSTGSAGETKPATVDLVETFNWLLGLRVKHIDHVRGVRVVDGTSPQGDRVLVLWRNTTEMNSEKLNAWFEKQGYSTLDMEYAAVYVNGDNNLENLRRADQTWKVRLIEEEFQRLMFDVQDA